MRITINVVRRDAAALAKTAQEVRAVGTAAQGTSGAMSGLGKSSSGATSALSRFGSNLGAWSTGVVNFGKNLQWTGRQIEFRFTLPIVAAMTAGTKWALAQEAAFVRVRKVYGDGSESADQLSKELDILNQYTLLLSNAFGKNREEVTNMMADWAAAGSAGVGLMKSTQLTLEASAVGELNLADATEALIAIQAGYRLSTDEMRLAMAQLNVVENTTQVTTSDLITVLEEVVGVAKGFGATIPDIAAMAASLVRITGSADEAGNALKSLMTGIMAPTNEAEKAFAEMGVALDGAWKNLNVTQRMEEMVGLYQKLDDGQKAYFARIVGTKWQIAKFGELMDDIAAGPLSRYRKVQEALAKENDAKNIATFNKELNQILTSNPAAFAQGWQQIRNSISEVMLNALPLIMHLLDALKSLVVWFNNLSPATQKWIIYGLMMLAVLGPLISYVGAIITLFGVFAKAIIFLGGALVQLIPFLMANPWVFWIAAVVAAIVIIYKFRHEIANALNDVVQAIFGFVGRAIDAFNALVTFMAKVVVKFYELLSYLNPFARHSPSLVESVTKGVATILDEYSRLNGISSILRGLIGDMETFNNATAGLMAQARAKDFGDKRSELSKQGATPDALGAFDAMVASSEALRARLPDLRAEISNQADVVERWARALKDADAALESAQAKLDGLSAVASRASDELDAARRVLDQLSNTGILGESAADQNIFDVEMGIKALRLELLRLEDAGEGVDDLSNRMARLGGEIEKLRALEKSLRMAGAGSEVLNPIRAQIAGLEAQRRATSTSGGGRAAELQKQIDLMERQREIMDLERSIKFDPLRRQLELLRNGIEELPFEELMARTRAQQKIVQTLTEAYDNANAAVAAQKQVVDAARSSRDAISKTYDLEREKLDALESAYREIESTIDSVTTAINDFIQARQAAGDGGILGPGGNWDPAVGTGGIGREGGVDDMLAELQRRIDEAKKKLDETDLFGGIKAKMDEFRTKWNEFWADVVAVLDNNLVKIGLIVTAFFMFGPFTAALLAIWLFRDEIKLAFEAVWAFMKYIWGEIGKAFDWGAEKIRGAWTEIENDFNAFKRFFTETIPSTVGDMKDAVVGKMNELVRFFYDLPDRLKTVASGMWDFIKDSFKGVINAVIGMWNGVHFPSLHVDGIDPFGDWGPGIPGFTIGGWSLPYIQPLAAGGIVMPRQGGTLARIAEAGVPEAVIPLDGKHGMGTTIVINGNLEFPNIRNGSDAGLLVKNLKVLAS